MKKLSIFCIFLEFYQNDVLETSTVLLLIFQNMNKSLIYNMVYIIISWRSTTKQARPAANQSGYST